MPVESTGRRAKQAGVHAKKRCAPPLSMHLLGVEGRDGGGSEGERRGGNVVCGGLRTEKKKSALVNGSGSVRTQAALGLANTAHTA